MSAQGESLSNDLRAQRVIDRLRDSANRAQHLVGQDDDLDELKRDVEEAKAELAELLRSDGIDGDTSEQAAVFIAVADDALELAEAGEGAMTFTVSRDRLEELRYATRVFGRVELHGSDAPEETVRKLREPRAAIRKFAALVGAKEHAVPNRGTGLPVAMARPPARQRSARPQPAVGVAGGSRASPSSVSDGSRPARLVRGLLSLVRVRP